MEIKDRILARMRDLGINNSELSERVGVSKATITFWLNGTNGLKAVNLTRLAVALACSERWLVTGCDAATPDTPALTESAREKREAELADWQIERQRLCLAFADAELAHHDQLSSLRSRIEALEAENAALKAQLTL